MSSLEVYRIVNITASFSFNCKLNLEEMAIKLPTAVYNPHFFSGLRYKMLHEGQRIAALIFSSGKVVLVGAKKETDLLDIAHRLAELMKTINIECQGTAVQVKNIVIAMDIKQKPDLKLLVAQFPKAASLEPELFPGLILTLNGRTKATIFRSGKINVTGLKNMTQVRIAVKRIRFLFK